MKAHAIPAELRERRQWVVWRLETRNGKPTKVPYQPANPGRRAGSTFPETWATLVQAVRVLERGQADGIGFVFTEADPFAGVDIDDCWQSRKLAADAVALVRTLDSYTELSPSGRGLHVIVRARLGVGCRKGGIEVYDRGRFFAMTGLRMPKLPASPMHRQAELDELVASLRPKPAPPSPVVSRAPVYGGDDADLIRRACAARNGPAFSRLWDGDWSGYQSQSEADAALVRHLSWWTAGDPVRVDQLFRRSGLYRAKWDRDDYRERTLALSGMQL